MKDLWQVFFFNGAPIWQYAEHIRTHQTDQGPVAFVNCTSVQQGPGGLLELQVLDESKTRELTFLVPAQAVLTAIRLRDRPELGFAPPLLSTLAQAVQPVLPKT